MSNLSSFVKKQFSIDTTPKTQFIIRKHTGTVSSDFRTAQQLAIEAANQNADGNKILHIYDPTNNIDYECAIDSFKYNNIISFALDENINIVHA